MESLLVLWGVGGGGGIGQTIWRVDDATTKTNRNKSDPTPYREFWGKEF